MRALSGSMRDRAAGAIAAGCDVALHCNGELGEMREVAEAAGSLDGPALARAQAALDCLRAPREFDRQAAERELERLMLPTA
jgi:beta-N-acetylhexosaminidase